MGPSGPGPGVVELCGGKHIGQLAFFVKENAFLMGESLRYANLKKIWKTGDILKVEVREAKKDKIKRWSPMLPPHWKPKLWCTLAYQGARPVHTAMNYSTTREAKLLHQNAALMQWIGERNMTLENFAKILWPGGAEPEHSSMIQSAPEEKVHKGKILHFHLKPNGKNYNVVVQLIEGQHSGSMAI